MASACPSSPSSFFRRRIDMWAEKTLPLCGACPFEGTVFLSQYKLLTQNFLFLVEIFLER
jgi:hypothetical protein